MPITVDQIIEEVGRWPAERVNELVDRLTAATQPADVSANEEAWRQETRRRVREIESGLVRGVPGDEVSERVRKIVGR